MFHLRTAYVPPIGHHSDPQEALVVVGAEKALVVRTGAVEASDLLYVGAPAIVAGAAVTILGGGLMWAFAAAVAAGGAGYLVTQLTGPKSAAESPPGTVPSPAAAPIGVKEMAYPGGSTGIESYAKETAEEKRARELGENWGYSYAIYIICKWPKTIRPKDPIHGYAPQGVQWKLAPNPTASAAEVMQNYKALGDIYNDAFKEAWDFGEKEVEKPDFDCSNTAEVLG